MKLAGATTAGPRPINEDSYYVLDFSNVRSLSNGITVFIMVADGMGGHEGGDIASRIAAQAAERYLGNLLEMAKTNEVELDVPAAFNEIVANANEAILAEMKARDKISMGTTFVGAFLSPAKAWIAHVGDSRAYLIHDGNAVQLTVDHSVVGRMLHDGLITEKQAQEHPRRNAIERALGMTFDDPEITEVSLVSGDSLMLCSDGVSTVLSNSSIANCFANGSNPENIANSIISKALRKGTDDNATVAIVVVGGGRPKTLVQRIRPAEQYTPAPTSEYVRPTGARSTTEQRISSRERESKRRSRRFLISLLAANAVLLLALAIAVVISMNLRGGKSVNDGNIATEVPAENQQLAPAETPEGDTQEIRSYKIISPEAELIYVDQDGRAQNFSPKVFIKEGVDVRAYPNTHPFQREKDGKEYRILQEGSDGYLEGLKNDIVTDNNAIYKIAQIINQDDYNAFKQALKNSDFDLNKITHLVINVNFMEE
jgi:protein phosphatase